MERRALLEDLLLSEAELAGEAARRCGPLPGYIVLVSPEGRHVALLREGTAEEAVQLMVALGWNARARPIRVAAVVFVQPLPEPPHSYIVHASTQDLSLACIVSPEGVGRSWEIPPLTSPFWTAYTFAHPH